MDHQQDSLRRNAKSPCGCSGACGGVDRREFLKLSGAGAASLAAWMGMSEVAGPFEPRDTIDHFVPTDKRLSPKWIELLTAKGQPDWYQGQDLAMVAMPVGGICAGQLYLAGDGRLIHWDIFNGMSGTGRAGTHYQRLPSPIATLKQGFAIRVSTQGASAVRTLDRQGFPDVRFRGEYPIGMVKYKAADLPVEVTLEAYSPFVPLSAADSALPATVMQFTVKNRSSSPAAVTLGGWLENGVCCHSGEVIPGRRANRVLRGEKMTMVLGSARASDELSDQPRLEFQGTLDQQRDFGTMGLAVLGGGAEVTAVVDLPDSAMAALLGGQQSLSTAREAEKPLRESLCGALTKTVSVPANGEAKVTFVVTWCFSNLPKNGNFYGTRFRDAQAVAAYVAENFERLSGQTRLWRDTWYDSTMPYWLLDRLFAPVSILATSTCQWWSSGRFWGWEGVRCCAGTCAHVWNYAHGMARLTVGGKSIAASVKQTGDRVELTLQEPLVLGTGETLDVAVQCE